MTANLRLRMWPWTMLRYVISPLKIWRPVRTPAIRKRLGDASRLWKDKNISCCTFWYCPVRKASRGRQGYRESSYDVRVSCSANWVGRETLPYKNAMNRSGLILGEYEQLIWIDGKIRPIIAILWGTRIPPNSTRISLKHERVASTKYCWSNWNDCF